MGHKNEFVPFSLLLLAADAVYLRILCSLTFFKESRKPRGGFMRTQDKLFSRPPRKGSFLLVS